MVRSASMSHTTNFIPSTVECEEMSCKTADARCLSLHALVWFGFCVQVHRRGTEFLLFSHSTDFYFVIFVEFLCILFHFIER